MSRMSRLSSLWRNLVRRDHVERDLDDEMDAVFALLVDEKIAGGMSPANARRAATLEIGRTAVLKDQVRQARAGAFLERLRQDVRYAVRSLRRTPGFTVTAVLTLGLGMGANITIFTLLDAVIFKPLSVPAAHELVRLYERSPKGVPDSEGGAGQYLSFSFPRFRRLRQAIAPQSSLAASTRSSKFIARFPGSVQALPIRAQLVSGGYFATLGVPAARGRLLTDEDLRVDGADPVAVISDGFWKRSLGSNVGILGQTIAVNGVKAVIVGITRPGFVGLWTDSEPDLWLPLTLQAGLRYQRNVSSYTNADRNQPWTAQDAISWLIVFGRVAPADLPRAAARLQSANHEGVVALADTFADGESRREMAAHTLSVEPLVRGFSALRSRFSQALFALAAMVAIVLLVTCANVANLLLTRAAGRARDLRIRVSLGATTARLLQQCLTESVILAGLGGAAGLLAGAWASGALARAVLDASGDLPPVFSLDIRVVVFSAGISLATALLFGFAPALRVIRTGRTAGFTTTERNSPGSSIMKGMRPLVACQLALSVVVVFAAFLLGRTLINFVRIDPGFAVDHLVSASFDPEFSGYQRDQMPALEQHLLAAAKAVPGVASAAVSWCGLVTNCGTFSGFRIEGATERVSYHENWVSPGYFATTGVSLVSGREFDGGDNQSRAHVAIITESIARRHFPGLNPLGKRLGFGEPDTEIVGVVRDVQSETLHQPPVPLVYFPIEQPPAFRIFPRNLDVRFAGAVDGTVSAIRETVRRAEPNLSLDTLEPMSARIARDVGRERIVAYLASAFAILALLLAALGLYGVLSYAVAGRTREIGVRIALGARPATIAMMVVRDALKLVAVGTLAGLLAAVATGRLLRALLFDVTVSDPMTYGLVAGVLAMVTLLAAYLPARRAARIDPTRALRSE